MTRDIWKDGFYRIARDKEIGAECYRVLFVILGAVDSGLFSPVTPAEISQILGCQPSSAKRAIRTLVGKGVIRKRHVKGKLVGYEIVEHFGV